MLRLWQPDALVSSRMERSPSKVIKIGTHFELSPYNQYVVSGYMRALDILDRYVNAHLLMSRRNSITQKPTLSVVSNIFDDLYPAKCEVVRRGPVVSWRTFDRVDRTAFSKLSHKAGRIVLVQDIDRRLLVTEQKSVHHRVIQIRLKGVQQHVLIVVNEKTGPKVPNVFYQGKLRRLPFRLYK